MLFLERTICCKVKTAKFAANSRCQFLERTICCKVKTHFLESKSYSIFLERTICCKVKTFDRVTAPSVGIFRKNNLL